MIFRDQFEEPCWDKTNLLAENNAFLQQQQSQQCYQNKLSYCKFASYCVKVQGNLFTDLRAIRNN